VTRGGDLVQFARLLERMNVMGAGAIRPDADGDEPDGPSLVPRANDNTVTATGFTPQMFTKPTGIG
jgi:hypothetical protein